MNSNKPALPAILYLSSFPPRQCGIATFTIDLIEAIDKEYSPEIKSRVLAINDNGTSYYNYPRKVALQIYESKMENYLHIANEINRMKDIKLVNIQHEYGLFGGDWGDYILPFLELLKKPVVVTMHTVLQDPPDDRIVKITQEIADRANGIVVITKTMARFLEEIYGVKKNKIFVIPHGIQNVAYPSKSRTKKELLLEDKIVLSSFGMINRDKGYEYAIAAMPEVIKKHPNALYLILGATHPNIRKQEGEVYRNKLKKLVEKLNLQEHVKFYDKYLTLQEKIDYLKATDIYVSPTLNPAQTSSGTVSDALSCACPVVATPNFYNQDVLDNGRGRFVRFKNSKDIEKAINEILSDRKMHKEMQKNAYFYSRHMTWQNVAISYFKVFNQFAKIVPKEPGKLPNISLNHIRTMTDHFGMIQFAQHTKPDIHSGYCLDDNARILLAIAMRYKAKKRPDLLAMMEKYFNFVKFSQKDNGKFWNFISYKQTFIDDSESEDTFGRTIWVLGYLISQKHIPEHMRNEARKIFNKAKNWITDLRSFRAVSFAIIGMSMIEKNEPSRIIRDKIIILSDKLMTGYRKQQALDDGVDWKWFEDCLTYSNFKLSEAMFRAFEATDKPEYLETARESINFLCKISFEDKDHFSPIGQDGWYFRGGKRNYFDQQPEDTSSAVEALSTAFEVTGEEKYKKQAKNAFLWFLGKNHLGQMVYDEATGGSFDGLGRFSLNFNQGAESTISYLLARLVIEKIF